MTIMMIIVIIIIIIIIIMSPVSNVRRFEVRSYDWI